MIAKLPRTFWYVWWGTLVNRLGNFVLPMLTIYLIRVRHTGVDVVGTIAMGFGAGQVVASIVGGQLADRVGRRATMLVSLFGGAAVMLALGQARDLAPIRVLVIALGFVGELYRPAIAAIVSDIVEPERRLIAFGYMYWAVNLGFAIAMSVGGLVADHHFELLFYADAATTLAFAVIVALRVPETRPAPTPRDPRARSVSPLRDLQFVIFLALAFCSAFIILQCGATLASHMTWQHLEPRAYGFVMALNGVLIVTLQPVLTRWSAGFDSSRVLAGAVLLMGAGAFVHGLAPGMLVHGGAVVIWTIGEILDSPTRSAIVAGMAPASARGRYQGSMVLAWGLATMAAPKLGTLVWTHVGPHAIWTGCLALSAIVAAMFLATGPARARRLTETMLRESR